MRLSYMVIAALLLNILFLKGEDLSLPDLNVDYKLKIAEIKVKLFDRAIENLEEKYQKRVKDLKSEYSKKGQLDAALLAEESINIIPTENSIEKYAKFKALSEIHKIYVESAEKIQNRYDVELIKVMKSYLEKLEKLKISLTRQENLEEAKTVQKQIKSVKESYLYRNRFQIDEVLTELNKKRPNRLPNNRFNKGLVAYYPFNGNANDESGNGNNGTVNGATLVTDREGNANSSYSFDGVDDYIVIENSPDLNFDDKMSISFWLKPNSWGQKNKDTSGIISKMLDKNSEGYVIYHDHTRGMEKLNFRSREGGGAEYNITDSKAVSGKWDHWTVTYKSGQIIWYRNGSQDKIYTNDPNDADLSNSASLYLGYTEHWKSWGFPSYFSGMIDDVRIYNRSLSSGEVSAINKLEKIGK
ncbi:LamG domain-containing protein [Verrucomicrobiales bacterium]|nr:LamG domain-containing protein [Verrucomicrobiales bacterium]